MSDVLLDELSAKDVLTLIEQATASPEVVEVREDVVATTIALADAMVGEARSLEVARLREINYGHQQLYWSVFSVDAANRVDAVHEATGDHSKAIHVGRVLTTLEAIARHDGYQTGFTERFGRPSARIATARDRAVVSIERGFRGLSVDRVQQTTKTRIITGVDTEVGVVQQALEEATISTHRNGRLLRRLVAKS